MAYYRLNAYDADVRIPEFLGLNQYGAEDSQNPCYAVEANNAYTHHGNLMPMAKCIPLPEGLNTPIQTLATLYRRWPTDGGSQNVLIAACDGQLYMSYTDGELSWRKLKLPSDWKRCKKDVWSFVNYQMGENEDGSKLDTPIDILLMSNDEDGLIYIRGDNFSVNAVDTLGKKFGVICLSNERVWGAAIPEDPDMLHYCTVYRPWNWQMGEEGTIIDLTDGAGDIQVPSWDGDAFCALKQFGSQLIAFKRTKVWRILGTNPGEYEFREQFGGGTAYPHTVAVGTNLIYMLSRQGIVAYNGESVMPFKQDFARNVWERMNQDALEEAYGCIFDNKYYLALPLDGSGVNNAVLVYNIDEGTFLLREGLNVEAFMPTETALYYTSHSTPGMVWMWNDNPWIDKKETEEMHWVSPWMDFNFKSKTKGSFTVYVTVECEQECRITFSVETEKKKKAKTVTFLPPAEGKKAKQKRMQFGGNGRRFRLHIDSESETPWRIIGGIMMVV